jgi:GT2 family glycosyltransferase
MTEAAGGGQSLLPEGYGKEAQGVLNDTAIVILTWNQIEETRRCLRSRIVAGYPLSSVVLWDNGSVDGTADRLPQEFPDVVYHYHPMNLGVASGRNAAASLALRRLAPSYLLFLDNDMVVSPGFLEDLRKPFEEDPQLAQTLAKIRFLHEPRRLQSAGGIHVDFGRGVKRTIGARKVDWGQYDEQRPCLPCGGATLVAADVFKKLNGFDSMFDPYGTEDIDFSLRVRSAGYRALYIPDAVVYHDYRCKLAGSYIDCSGIASAAERWMLLMERHASLSEKIRYWSLCAPYKLLRAIGRESLRGNLRALGGIPQGLGRYIVRLIQRRRIEPRLSDVGIETD